MKNMQAKIIHDDFLKIQKILQSKGSDPKVCIMDNECSGELKEAMKKYGVDLQLAPPHMHRRNAAEQSIRTCKNHFIAVFSMIDPYFPIN